MSGFSFLPPGESAGEAATEDDNKETTEVAAGVTEHEGGGVKRGRDEDGDGGVKEGEGSDGDQVDAKRQFTETAAAAAAAAGTSGSGGDGAPVVDQKMLKLLVPGSCAGGVIGRGGANISEMQTLSGARLKLSPNREFFPDTDERTLMLSGTEAQLRAAVRLVLAKILDGPDGGAPTELPRQGESVAKLAVPNPAAGTIIGEKGATIQQLQEGSGSRIRVSPRARDSGLAERLVVVQASDGAKVKHAVELILNRLFEDPANTSYSNKTTTYNSFRPSASPLDRGGYGGGGSGGGGGYGVGSAGGYGGGDPYRAPAGDYGRDPYAQPDPYGAPSAREREAYARPSLLGGQGGGHDAGENTTVVVSVPDDMVGAVVGRGGRVITDLQSYSGARIKISPKGEYVPGTSNRIVTITGTPNATQTAQYLIHQKISEAQVRGPPRTTV